MVDKILFVKDLPGLGPASIEKLEAAGYTDLMTLAVANSADLAVITELSEATVKKAILVAKQNLDVTFETGIDAQHRRDKVQRITTGSKQLDGLLLGGFETSALTECYGQFGCLTGDTLINYHRTEVGRVHSIKWLYNQFHHNPDDLKGMHGHQWELTFPTFVRSFNGETIQLHRIADVVCSGKKEVVVLALENGNSIKATPEHKFMTRNGWKELRNLTNNDEVMLDTLHTSRNKGRIRPKLGNAMISRLRYHPFAQASGKNSKGRKTEAHRLIYEAHMNGVPFFEYLEIVCNEPERAKCLKYVDPATHVVHHKDGNHFNNTIENLELLSREEHLKHHGKATFKNFHQGFPRFSKVKSKETAGIEDTYDIVCEEPHHNFVANGMVVHNSGKSQLAHILSVRVQLPVEKGGLDGVAVFIDTENTFRPERIRQIAEGLKLEPEKVLSNIRVARAFNSSHQMLLAQKVEDLIKQGVNVRLIVIDSLTAHFRTEFIGRGTLADRQQHINTHMHSLLRLADLYNVCVYASNQVMSRPDTMFGDPTEAIGGHVLHHNSTYRVYLRRGRKGTRIAKMVDAPNIPESEASFAVCEDGIKDA